MHLKKRVRIWFILLSVVNILIFIYRDYFQYEPLSSAKDLYGACDASCERKWEQYIHDYPEEELAEAKIITDALVKNRAATTEKILAIGNHIYKAFHLQSGKPSDSLLIASPLEQYKKLSTSETEELWCGNFAQMFSFFCWSQGIICRNIEIRNPGDHHVINECYLPEENRWIQADLTNNLLLVKDSTGRLLNFIEFRQGVTAKSKLQAFQFNNDSIRLQLIDPGNSYITEYYSKSHPAYYYHRVNNKNVYSMPLKVKRYFLPLSWYEILNDTRAGNFLFYLKIFFIAIWIFTFFALFSVNRIK